MAKELLSRKCSHCGHNGHNSRTCSRVVKLFGVKLTAIDGEIQMRKSVSAGDLLHYRGFNNVPAESGAAAEEGYLSDGLVHTSTRSRDRKKGMPWSEEEHRLFLVGLGKLGKGDWRGISRSFVITRTPTQVASHAQKYFLRQSSLHKRKRRSSLFDMCPYTQNATSFSIKEDSLEKQHDILPNLSVAAAPELSLSISTEQDGESIGNTQPQLLLPLWPELQCSSSNNSNTDTISKAMEDDGENSELSLSIAPPTPSRLSNHKQYYCDSKLNYNGDFMTSAAIIRVV